jgi:hypothetical protein
VNGGRTALGGEKARAIADGLAALLETGPVADAPEEAAPD